MHLVALPFSLLVSLSLLSAPRSVHAQARTRLSFSSIPEDLYAFPKYRVRFLNQLPVSNTTAQRWLQEGLRGGENEFLEREWHDRDTRKGADRRTIGGPDAGNVEVRRFALSLRLRM
jgi:protein OS-9